MRINHPGIHSKSSVTTKPEWPTVQANCASIAGQLCTNCGALVVWASAVWSTQMGRLGTMHFCRCLHSCDLLQSFITDSLHWLFSANSQSLANSIASSFCISPESIGWVAQQSELMPCSISSSSCFLLK